ncbi:MAG: hypothetical protein AB1765_12195 [Candidatus Hydrogenedentota bacterium]
MILMVEHLRKYILFYLLIFYLSSSFVSAIDFEKAQELFQAKDYNVLVTDISLETESDTRVLFLRAYGAEYTNQTKEAIVTYLRILKIEPTNFFAIRALGILFLTDYPDKSITFLSRACEYQPNDPLTHFYLGRAYRANNEIDKAISHFLVASMNPPLKINSLLQIAEMYVEKGEKETAISILLQAKWDPIIKNYLSTLGYEVVEEKEVTEVDKFDFSLYFNRGYNDNILLVSQSAKTPPSNMADHYTSYTLELDYTFVTREKYGLYLKSTLTGLGYDDRTDYDQTTSENTLTPCYFFTKKLYASLESVYYFTELDGASYLSSYSFSPLIGYNEWKNLWGKLSYEYRKDNYRQDSTSEQREKMLGIEEIYYFTAGHYVSLKYLNRKNHAFLAESDYDGYDLGSTIYLDLKPLKSYLTLYYLYQSKDYKVYTTEIEGLRHDDMRIASAELSRELFSKNFYIVFAYYFTNSNSNLERYTYEQRYGSIGFLFNY